MLQIKDSVAVITGGAGGIGLALARYWVGGGGKVVLADVDQNALQRALDEFGPDKAAVLACNVTSEDDNAALAELALEKFGAINLVAPFAGIIRDGLLLATDRETGKVKKKMALADFEKVVDINLTGVFFDHPGVRPAHG